MITLSQIFSVLAILFLLWILFKIYESVRPAIAKIVPEPWGNVIFWVLVLIVAVWALGYFGIMQPLVK